MLKMKTKQEQAERLVQAETELEQLISEMNVDVLSILWRATVFRSTRRPRFSFFLLRRQAVVTVDMYIWVRSPA